MSTYLTADRFGTPTNAKKYTLATWFKIVKKTNNNILNYNYGSGQRGLMIQIRSNDQTLRVNDFTAAVTDHYDVRTTRQFRDYGAWYHLVVAYDSTQSTASDRVKIYINGVQETSFAASSYPSQDLDSFIATTPQNNKGFNIGAYYNSSGNIDAGNYFCGYMSQYIFVDGTAYTPSTFGSTNANGVWIPNTAPSVTYGTNGFKLEMKHSGASAAASNFGADTSGNNNHFTSNNLGTYPNVKDSPANIFCTINELSQQPSNPASITEGGLKATNDSSANTDNNQARILGTIFPTTGKWYMEIKYVSGYSATDGSVMVGLMSSNVGRATTYSYGFHKNNGNDSHTVGYGNNGKIWYNGSEQTTGLTTFTTGDILGMAMDLTNGKFFASKNGTFFSNGTGTQDPANGTNPLYSSTNIQNPSDGMTPGIALYSNPNGVAQFNYGSPTFTIASGNADANGYGNFEYAVPSGFYALCTKNLAQYG